MLHNTPFEQVEARLATLGLIGVSARFWEAVRANLDRLSDAVLWWDVVKGPIQPLIENRELLAVAARLLPGGDWDDGAWPGWTSAIAAETGLKGKALFMPLRKALTGQDHGPDMKTLLPLIGYERAAKRLAGEAA
jgi:glutamyl-tRNA synthetase